MTETNWLMYDGLLKENKKEGVGYIYFSNDDIFCGEFKNDEANGFGIYKYQDNNVCGIWSNNKLVERIN